MLRKHMGKGLTFLLATFFFTGALCAEEVLVVKFPQGEVDGCKPATGSFTVRGPGIVTIKIKLSPYMSLGFVPNIPVGFRAVGSDNRFTGAHPLPNCVRGKATQLGQEVQNFKDNVPIEFQSIYKLDQAKEYVVEVQASPQCRMLSQKIYWQEGQEVRVSVESEGATITTSPTPPTPPVTPPTPPVVETVPSSAVLASKVWEFGRGDGTVLVPRIRLLSGGRIEGAAHPNESRWAVVGNELLFFDAAGKVSTRYNSFRQEGGRWVISGPFLLWGNITHVLKEVGETQTAVESVPSNAVLASKVWEFGRGDGTVLVPRIRLLSGGRIEGAAHPNESRWAVVGNELLFFDAAGKVSTRYKSFRQEGGRWVISGPFLLWGNITHVLKEVK